MHLLVTSQTLIHCYNPLTLITIHGYPLLIGTDIHNQIKQNVILHLNSPSNQNKSKGLGPWLWYTITRDKKIQSWSVI